MPRKKKQEEIIDLGKYAMDDNEISRLAKEHGDLVKQTNRLLSGMREIVDKRHGRVSVTDHVYFLVEKDKREACPQRTTEWYEKRNNHVTASLMASVCNANPYDRRSNAFKKKTGAGVPFTGNAATRHGNYYEQEAIEKYEERTGQKSLDFGLLESINDNEEFLAGRLIFFYIIY